MIYGIETRAETNKTKQLIRTADMSTLRTIIGKARLGRIGNEDVTQQWSINDI